MTPCEKKPPPKNQKENEKQLGAERIASEGQRRKSLQVSFLDLKPGAAQRKRRELRAVFQEFHLNYGNTRLG